MGRTGGGCSGAEEDLESRKVRPTQADLGSTENETWGSLEVMAQEAQPASCHSFLELEMYG